MNRKERVFQGLELLLRHSEDEKGFSATRLALELGLDRANVSRDLNVLVRENRIQKSETRPVLFSIPSKRTQLLHDNRTSEQHTNIFEQHPIESEQIAQTRLDRFSAINPTLFHQVEQAKAAILYPPKGMHVLLFGKTGVGKSMFAQLLFDYAIDIGRFKNNAPFIQFNCADYANNPQLLMSTLFGHVQGAYTGATSDQVGLLKRADGGILFLDEVHRLPIEGQEMLFTFIDRGTFKPLGETKTDQTAKVILIAATTESRDDLLATFIRRIPMIINLPSLSERSIEERFQLMTTFIQEEVDKLNIEIQMSVNATKAFLSYDCPGNIGQLKNDLQIVCARAYVRFITSEKKHMLIKTADLPDEIKSGLYNQTSHRRLWSIFQQLNEQYFTYMPNHKENLPQLPNIYEKIDERYQELEENSTSLEEIRKTMEFDLQDYFKHSRNQEKNSEAPEHLAAIIPEALQEWIDQMTHFAESQMEVQLSNQVKQALAIHVFNLIERIKAGKLIKNPELTNIHNKYPKLFDLALQCVGLLEEHLHLTIPEDEAGYLVLFFTYDHLAAIQEKQPVEVIVIAHGEQTASALCQTVDSLLGNTNLKAINASLDEKPAVILEKLFDYLASKKVQQDVILLVDMGSLMTFAAEVEEKFDIQARAIPLVSTMHVLEASRKAMLGYSLVEVFNDTLKVNDYLKEALVLNNNAALKYFSTGEVQIAAEEGLKPLAIISLCLTGEGTAQTIKNILEEKLDLELAQVTLLTLNLLGEETVQKRLEEIQQHYRIICVVSSFHIQTQIPQIDLYQVINGEGISLIKQKIDEEQAYLMMGETVGDFYDLSDASEIVQHIYRFNTSMENLLNRRFNTNQLIGVSFHILGMILKDRRHEAVQPFSESTLASENDYERYDQQIKEWFKIEFELFFSEITDNYLNYISYSYLNLLNH